MKGFKKMGLMFLALVIALAGIGVGYAAWTDTITIRGTVNTGDVDLEVTGYSGTYVYKDTTLTGTDEHEIIVVNWDSTGDPPTPDDTATRFLVASAVAKADPTGAADVLMVWDNLFPCIDFKADVKLHYNGSIPVKINKVTFDWGADSLTSTWGLQQLDYTVTATLISSLITDDQRIGQTVDAIGYQLHLSDTIELVVTIHVPQDNRLMNVNGWATAEIEVVQWNEYPYVPD